MAAGVRIYPIFIPHLGCPFQCVYCNQNAVTDAGLAGCSKEEISPVIIEKIARLAEDSKRSNHPGEISFYGGTFTALPTSIVRDLLDAASYWVGKGVFSGIRFSTRPDGITPDICSLLEAFPVSTVELGVQSLSNHVLKEARRGYAAETVLEAARLVRERGWTLGVQLMPGLPGDSRARFMETVSGTVAMRPGLVRIYPTLVLEGTRLFEWLQQGLYKPLSLDEAISWCVEAYEAFLQVDIPVARMGLHADPELEKPGRVQAGPHHPAFGYLVRVHWWRDRADRRLQTMSKGSGRLKLVVPSRSISEVKGPALCNLSHWKEKWLLDEVTVQGDPSLQPMQMELLWQ